MTLRPAGEGAGQEIALKTDSRLDKPLEECNFVFFDIETTGLDCSKCHIIEVAAVEFRGGREVARYTSFVKPIDPDQQPTLFGMPAAAIPSEVVRITRITDDMVKDAPEFQAICPDLVRAFGDGVLVAHNAEFDLSFLAAKMEAIGVPRPKNPILDTLKISRAVDKGAPSHSMDSLKRKYAIKAAKSHRALDDSLALAQLFEKLVNQIPAKQGLRLADVLKVHGAPLEFKVYPTQAGRKG